MATSYDSVLNDVYYGEGNPAYLAGQQAVLREARKVNKKIRLSHVLAYLQKQDTYTLHKPRKRRFPRNRTIPIGWNTDWMADLIDVASIKKHNQNNTFILTVKDILSRFCWAEPLKNKKPETVRAAFQKIIERAPRVCWRLFTDKGNEFLGQPMKTYLAGLDIQHITPNSPDVKCGSIENYNKILKSRLWKMFTHKKSYTWLPHLQMVVKALNNSYCRPINGRPSDVTADNASALWDRLYGKGSKKVDVSTPSKLHVGSWVRICEYKNTFEKGYTATFTKETFRITKVLSNRIPTVYKIEDSNSEPILGVYYKEELVAVVQDKGTVFQIEKIVKRKPDKEGKIKLLVKWKGYPSQMNSWIPAEDLITTE